MTKKTRIKHRKQLTKNQSKNKFEPLQMQGLFLMVIYAKK